MTGETDTEEDYYFCHGKSRAPGPLHQSEEKKKKEIEIEIGFAQPQVDVQGLCLMSHKQ
jgi:hypothetical protein